MTNIENFNQPKAEIQPDISFGITGADNKALINALRPDKASSSDLLPPLTLVDQGDHSLNTGGWTMYNAAGGDTLIHSDDAIHLAIDSRAAHKGDPGILHHLDLPAQQETSDQATSGQQTSDQKTPGQKTSDQMSSIQDGEPLHIKFLARSDQSDPLTVGVMQSKSPYAPTLDEHVKLTPQWKVYDFDGVVPTDGTKIDLHFSTPGAVDIKNVHVTPESPEQIGVNPHDLTPAGMNENIDRYRKGELKVNIVDQNGKPVPGSDVRIEQTKQDFLFGTEVQGLKPDDRSQSQQEYQKALKDTFNFATVTPYWPQTQEKDQPGKNNFDKTDKQIEWLDKNGISVKVHPAFWPHWEPNSLPDAPDQAAPIIDKHTQDFAQHFSKFPNVRFIENNEVAAALTDSTNNGATNWVKEVGAPNAVEHETAIEEQAISGQAHTNLDQIKAGPDSSDKTDKAIQIVYNDYKNNQQEIQMLDQLQKDGKLPDVIGIQMHMTQGNWPLEKVDQIVDKLAKYGKPIYISEISVLSGEHRTGDDKSQADWKSTTKGEQEQAAYVRDLYNTLYSNPHVKGITWWDLSDKGAWEKAPRGLLRHDMSDKPAYDVLHGLIKNDWETNDHAASDANGNAQQRVFAGDYDLSVTEANGQTVQKHVHIGEGESKAITIEVDQ